MEINLIPKTSRYLLGAGKRVIGETAFFTDYSHLKKELQPSYIIYIQIK